MPAPETVTIGDHTYTIKQLGLDDSQEVITRLGKIASRLDFQGLVSSSNAKALTTLVGALSNEDIHWFRSKLLGANVTFENETGSQVPLGDAVVQNHFAGRLGHLMRLLGHCIQVNFGQFFEQIGTSLMSGENK